MLWSMRTFPYTFHCHRFQLSLGKIFWKKYNLRIWHAASVHSEYWKHINVMIVSDLDLELWPPFKIWPFRPARAFVFHEHTTLTHANYAYYYVKEWTSRNTVKRTNTKSFDTMPFNVSPSNNTCFCLQYHCNLVYWFKLFSTCTSSWLHS